MKKNLKAVLRRNLQAALARGELAEAGELLERLKEEDPLAVETRGMELELLLKSGRLGEAEALSAQLLELFADSARIHYLAGRLAYRKKDYLAAERHLRESHRLYPHWHTLHLTGKALTQRGRLEEAEAILEPLAREHPECRLDLAWLHERKGDLERALGAAESYLERYPQNEFALSQRQRLRARILSPEELLEEVGTLIELGERVSDEILPEYIESLLKSGQGARARSFLKEREAQLGARPAARVAWACYRLQAHDLACELFLRAFPDNRANYKLLTALEKAAERAGRLPELLKLYREHAPEAKHLYGRARSLARRMGE